MEDLTDEQKAIIDFERDRYKYAGAREGRIRDQFGISATTYSMQLNHILDLPAALAYDPLGVKRLLRLREQRRALRSRRDRLG